MVLAMRGMPFQTEAVRMSLLLTSVETVCNVAVVRAIFPGAVFSDAKCLPAIAADDLAFTAMGDQFRVGIPPFGSAGIRADNSAFPSGSLNQNCSTALTHFFCVAGLVRNRTAQSISFAKGLDGIYGHPHKMSDFLIAVPLSTKGDDLLFL